jgi:hypothetical protein
MNTLAALRSTSGALLAGAVICVPVLPTGAQVAIRRSPTAFNLFTVEQDIEISQRSAVDIEHRVRLITSTRTSAFLGAITNLLAARISGTKYPFQVDVINSAEVNAHVLPGGRIFVTRGLLSLARNEAEVASLIAHAMAHVVLRHGTARASRAYFSKAGLGALGGLVGKAGATTTMVATVGGYGLNPVFVKFNRADEYDADALGAELMSQVGYDPIAMATLLATIRRDRGRIQGIGRYFANHPPADDREIRIRNLANVLRSGAREVVGGFARMRWQGGPAAAPQPEVNVSAGSVEVRYTPATPDVPAPSTQFTRFSDPDALVAIDHPTNWTAHRSGGAMSFVPSGAVVDSEEGAPSLLQGAVVNHYAPFEDDVERWNNSLTRHFAPFPDRSRPRGILEDATDDLVRQILDVNGYLRASTGSARAEVVDGLRGYSVRLSGRSPVTGEVQRVTVYTRMLPDEQVVYLACIAAGRTVTTVERACSRMAMSIRVNEAANIAR